MDAVRDGFSRIQNDLAGHADKWDKRAEGSKASIRIDIELRVENAEDSIFSIHPTVKCTLPQRPKKPTAAMGGVNHQTGELCLFVRDSGSTDGDPKQMHLPMKEKVARD